MKKFYTIFFYFLFITLLFCDFVDFVDAEGSKRKIKKNPKKVVSLYASFTELWLESGGSLVGVSTNKRIAEKTKGIKKLGRAGSPNLELILSLEPDLILLKKGFSSHKNLENLLNQLSIPHFYIDYSNFEEFLHFFQVFTDLNSREDIYLKKSKVLKEGIKTFLKAYGNNKNFKYILLFSGRNISAKDSNLASSIINDFGGINIAKKTKLINEKTRQFSLEKILMENPDYIFVQTMGNFKKAQKNLDRKIKKNKVWAELKAVKNNRFIYLPKELFLYKPNMKFLKAYETIYKILEKGI